MLHAFPRDAARLAVGGLELVDLVDENDAVLCLGDIAAGLVDEPLQDGLDFLIDVARLCERGRLCGHERHIQRA